MYKNKLTVIDLFAGAGGLSEGFIRAGFDLVAHIEMDEAACYTLRTRMAYHWLKAHNKLSIYKEYLQQNINRSELYETIPAKILDSVICSEIGSKTTNNVFKNIDSLLDGRKLDLLIGGPPCQAYSLVGRSCDKNGMRGDKRNYLFMHYAEFLKRYSPKYFVFENVTGLLSAKDAKGNLYLDSMKRVFREIGYTVEVETLIASEYGVPQNRKRVILVGRKGKKKGFYPSPKKVVPKFCINDLFADLPSLSAGAGKMVVDSHLPSSNRLHLQRSGILFKQHSFPLTLHVARPHQPRDLEIYRRVVDAWNQEGTRAKYNDLPEKLKTHRNRHSFTDRYKVVAGNKFTSHTVMAHISKDGHYYIHPDIKQNRSLTPREAARLQTFPDDYFFESISETPGRTAPYKQIGNAVPVLLAQKIAESLLENW